MTDKSQGFLTRLKKKYSTYGDNESLLALADIEKSQERARELRIYREQDKTQELIKAVLTRYKVCVYKLTSSDSAEMTAEERTYCLATMDWCKFTLDIIGENPEIAEKMIDSVVESYAKKAGIA